MAKLKLAKVGKKQHYAWSRYPYQSATLCSWPVEKYQFDKGREGEMCQTCLKVVQTWNDMSIKERRKIGK